MRKGSCNESFDHFILYSFLHVKVGSGFGVGLALSSVLLGAAAALSMGLVGTLMGGSETTE